MSILRSPWRWVGLGAVGLALAGLAALGVRSFDPLTPDSEPSSFALWQAATVYRFSVRLDHDLESRLPLPGDPPPMTVRSRLQADLRWSVFSVTATVVEAELRWDAVRQAGVWVEDDPTLPPTQLAEALRLSSVRFALPLDGGAVRFAVDGPAEAEAEVARVAGLLLGQLAWRQTGPEAMAFDGERIEGRVRYELTEDRDPLATTYTRSLVAYSWPAMLGTAVDAKGLAAFKKEASGMARIVADGSGLLSWDEAARFQVRTETDAPWASVTSRVVLERLSVGKDAPVFRPSSAPLGYRTDMPPESEQVRRGLLESQAAGRSFEDILDDLRFFAATENRPDDKRRVWQTVGYLDLHPERIPELEAAFFDGGLSTAARDRILDLLAALESPPGQRAILRILGRLHEQGAWAEVAEGAKRLMLVKSPEPATARALAAWLDSPEIPVRFSAAVSLGAVVHRLAGQQPALAAQYNRRLQELAKEPHPSDPAAIAAVTALGNAGQADNVPVLAEIASRTAEPTVRAHAAYALRHVHTPEAIEWAARFSEDEHPVVQARAFDVLGGYRSVPPEVIKRTVERLSEGSIRARSFEYVVRMLRTHDGEAAKRGIQIVRNHPETDPQLRGRLARMLKENP